MSDTAPPSRNSRPWVLMSIKPRYAEQIMAGTKTVELRRRPLPATVEHVAVYASAPSKKVVGTFRVVRQVLMPPDAAWQQYERVAGISQGAFDDYFAGAAQACVIELADVRRLRRPMDLIDVRPGLRPPVSWRYLAEAMIAGSLVEQS